MTRSWSALPALLVLTLPAPAQPPKPPEVPTVKLTLRPAAEPVPALKYRLLPDLREQTPGNAAPLYYRAFSPEWQAHRRQKDYAAKSDKWSSLPLKELPKAEMQWLLTSPMLKEVDRAARRTYCDFELGPRMKEGDLGLILTDSQSFRELAHLLKLRARLQMAEGRPDRAVATLQTGLTLGRHVGEASTLIRVLVGNAIAYVMLGEVEELIQQPGAPNLYWALTDLPRPFLDLRQALGGERLYADSQFPGPEMRKLLLDETAEPLSPKELQEMVARIKSFSEAVGGLTMVPLALAATGSRVADARKLLVERGRPPDQVQAMPNLQVMLTAETLTFDQYYDEMLKWHNLPYWQARPGLERARKAIRAAEQKTGRVSVVLVGLVGPAFEKVLESRARVDRKIAALRVVEALRLHAAAHKGKLPPTLADVTAVPIPDDPFTGKPFAYTLAGDKAVLSGPPPAGATAHPGNSFRYEITLAP